MTNIFTKPIENANFREKNKNPMETCPVARASTSSLKENPSVPQEDPNVPRMASNQNEPHPMPASNPPITVENVAEVYEDENARRLAEYVVKMDDLRKNSGTDGFKNTLKQQSEQLLNNLYVETTAIEKHVFIGEVEMFKKNEDAFFNNLNELELFELKSRQEEELIQLKIRQAQILKDYEARKVGKLNTLKQQRELKLLYAETQYRAEVVQKTVEIKYKLSAHRQKIAKIVSHIEERHAKQIVQFNAAEERIYKNKKLLLDLQCQGLNEEERGEAQKRFQSKLNHQKVIHKKRLEHTQQQQRLELRQFKEKAEKQAFVMEELTYLKARQFQQEQELVFAQKDEYYAAKDKIQAAKKVLKLADFKYQNNAEISKFKANHRNKVRELKKEHKQLFATRKNYWVYVLGKEEAYNAANLDEDFSSSVGSHSRTRSNQSASQSSSQSANQSNLASTAQSKTTSRRGSDTNLRAKKQKEVDLEHEEGEKVDVDATLNEKNIISKLQNQLVELRKKHNEALYNLKSENEKEYAELKEKLEAELEEMELNHDVERKRLVQEADNEIAETLETQEKEILLENHIREAETKALVERQVLLNMLDTFSDGVVSIDNRGYIQRFNLAAEKMFGYKASEVMEKRMNIKALMPPEIASKHDTYLYNYFTTGIKKAIANGLDTMGMKSDGTKFPIHLAISEVVDAGFHQFTAIIRDLTPEIEAENYKQSTETQLMWQVDRNGKVLLLNQRFRDYYGITKGQDDSVNVFGEDVVHPNEYQAGVDAFASANRNYKPFSLRRRLKAADGSYRWFLTKAIPVFDIKGKFKQWYGSCTDIDDAVLLEAELETLQEKLPVLIWKSDPNGELFYGNQQFKEYTGIDFETNKTLFYSDKLCFGKDYAALQEAFEKAKARKSGLDFKFRLKNKDGKIRWFHGSASPILDPNGKLLSFCGVCKDVDEAEKIAREMAILPENLPQLIWKSDPKGNVVYCNSQFSKYIGAPPGAQLNVFDKALVHPEDYSTTINAFAAGNRDKKSFIIKNKLKCGDGTFNVFTTKGIPILDDLNAITGWYGTCTMEE
ncbi:hypothetical protein HDV04_004507 [Boothiomyces sp. JEL0838]|nr:hypothetical protein HDV04_004507 [Boothiomyces sp. JEL0838]